MPLDIIAYHGRGKTEPRELISPGRTEIRKMEPSLEITFERAHFSREAWGGVDAPLFWTGKLTPIMKVLVNANSLLAWLSGNAGDAEAMKERMKSGYERARTDDVTRYDELGLGVQTRSAKAQLEGIDVRGMEALNAITSPRSRMT